MRFWVWVDVWMGGPGTRVRERVCGLAVTLIEID